MKVEYDEGNEMELEGWRWMMDVDTIQYNTIQKRILL